MLLRLLIRFAALKVYPNVCIVSRIYRVLDLLLLGLAASSVLLLVLLLGFVAIRI